MAGTGSSTMINGPLWLFILLIVLFVLAAAALVVSAYLLRRKHRQVREEERAEESHLSTMMENLQRNTLDVDVLRQNLQDGVERVQKMEMDLQAKEADMAHIQARAQYSLAAPGPWINGHLSVPESPTPPSRTGSHGSRGLTPHGPRPMSNGSVHAGLLPHSALGLQHLPRSRSGSAASDSSVYSTDPPSYKPPSTIPEETSSAADSPVTLSHKGTSSPAIIIHTDGSIRIDSRRSSAREDANISTYRPTSLPSTTETAQRFHSKPSHPDLVPQPLAVVKRNSMRDSTSGLSGILEGVNKRTVRRSASNPVSGKSYLQREDKPVTPPDASPTDSQLKRNSGMLTPPPTAATRSPSRIPTLHGRPLPHPHVAMLPTSKPAPTRLPPPPPVVKTNKPYNPTASPTAHPSFQRSSPSKLLASRSPQKYLPPSYASSQCLPHVGSEGTISLYSCQDENKENKENMSPMPSPTRKNRSTLLREMSMTLRFVEQEEEEMMV